MSVQTPPSEAPFVRPSLCPSKRGQQKEGKHVRNTHSIHPIHPIQTYSPRRRPGKEEVSTPHDYLHKQNTETRSLSRPPVALVPRRELILLIPDPLAPALIPIRIPEVPAVPLPTTPRRRRPILPPDLRAPLPHAAHDRRRNVRHAADGRHDGVRDGEGRGRAHGVEADAAVYHAQEEQEAAVPDVHVRDWRAGAVLAVVAVVEEAEGGLEDHCRDDDGAEDGVGVSEELGDVSDLWWMGWEDEKGVKMLTVPTFRAVM